jgi:iron(III) transport system substrate-binding protein
MRLAMCSARRGATRRGFIRRAAAVLVLSLFSLAEISVVHAEPLSALALSENPDRHQRLVEGATREGALNLYTSMTAATAAKVKADFERRYPGVKINLWRASSELVLQRVVTEARAKRHVFDVMETNGPEMEAAQGEKLLQAVVSAHFRDLISEALMPHREWVATRLNLFVQCFNTKLVKPEELPKSFEDLLHPRWKGRLAIEAADPDWFMSVIGNLGEEKGLKLFKDIVASNGMTVRKGHAVLAELVIAGEIPLSLTCYNFKIDQDRKAGAPVDWISIGPVIARPNGAGISRYAPHPHAALLFYEYMISEAQPFLTALELVPVARKIESPIKGRASQIIDPKKAFDEKAKWEKLYTEIFTSKSR